MNDLLFDEYATLQNSFDRDDCFTEVCWEHDPWYLIDSRRRAYERAHELAHSLKIGSSPKILTDKYRIFLGYSSSQAPPYGLSNETDDSIFSPEIENAIEASRILLELEDDWDEEGGVGYSEETWKRTTQFIRKTALLFKNEYGKWVNAPKITPGPDGSIDVRWKTDKRSLLVNFPASETKPVDYFGSDKGIDTVKGTLNLSLQNHWLLHWLMR